MNIWSTLKFCPTIREGQVMRGRGEKSSTILKIIVVVRLVFLQETHSTKRHENLWKYQWHGDMIFSHDMEHLEAGVSVLLFDTM